VVISQYLIRLGLLSKIIAEVRFARRRSGDYDVIDFVAVLIGYAISGEKTLKEFYERLQPFAGPYMALFGRENLPARPTLSRFLAALNQAPVEALRTLFQDDVTARPLAAEGEAGLWDRRGGHWRVYDTDGTRQAARQRALPQTPDRPTPFRRLDAVCAPGYTGRKRGEVVRTRTTILQAHTQRWLGTFAGAGNGDYRGELLQAIATIRTHASRTGLPLSQVLMRLDGLYGDGAIVCDLEKSGLAYVIRGKDYGLLDLPQVQACLAQPPVQEVTHPESGLCRALFDCPDVPVSPVGPCMRLMVATHQTGKTPARIGTMRDGIVYELFYTVLPQESFTAADVLALYQHRGASETVLADEDVELDTDRWCSYTHWGQEFWQIIAQWIWNIRTELGHHLHPTPMRQTLFASALPEAAEPLPAQEEPLKPPTTPAVYGPSEWARTSRVGLFAGDDFHEQADGTLRCPADHPLYAQERRLERDGALRVVYAARIAHCRDCPLQQQCLAHGKEARHPRRVSALRWPIEGPSPPPEITPALGKANLPILWGDWPRTQMRRRLITLLRTQTVTINVREGEMPACRAEPHLWTREQRAHYRLTWQERLARNASRTTMPRFHMHLFGIPTDFAQFVGLAVA
jgi:hypothetical protein